MTTAQLGPEQLAEISYEVGPEHSMLGLCPAFRGNAEHYPILTVKKHAGVAL